MTTYDANKEILKIIEKAMEDNPNMRFTQLLRTLNIVKVIKIIDAEGYDNIVQQDEFYTQSQQILKRMKGVKNV